MYVSMVHVFANQAGLLNSKSRYEDIYFIYDPDPEDGGSIKIIFCDTETS